MPVKLKWPWLGIAIPCFLISFIGYGSHYFILHNFLSPLMQAWFQCSLTLLWLSYYLAIYTNPGKPSHNFEPFKYEWKNYCKKCQNFKPERAHHCKTCDQCVLMMDHHCPWTMNCVGYKNFPYFLRFLFWVIATTGFLSIQLAGRIIFLWNHKNLPQYMFHTSELIFLTILTPLNGFVLLSITILFGRCLANQILGGKSQIESWEMERLEDLFFRDKLIPRLIESAWEIFPEVRARISESMAADLEIELPTKFDDLVNFPYDLEPWQNATQLLGSSLLWLWPFGEPNGNGVIFPKNENAQYSSEGSIEDILLSLPWPPDGGKIKTTDSITNNIESITKQGESLIRRRLPENDNSVTRKQWQNNWGENLEDFGVDVDTEQIY